MAAATACPARVQLRGVQPRDLYREGYTTITNIHFQARNLAIYPAVPLSRQVYHCTGRFSSERTAALACNVFNTYLIVAATELEPLTAVNLHWPNTAVPTHRISCHVSRCCCCVPATEPDSPSIYSMIKLPSSRAQVSVTGMEDTVGQRIVIYCTIRRDKMATR
jgi:hypothetical protein